MYLCAMFRKITILLFVLAAVLMFSCSEFKKIQKSENNSLKFKSAVNYYNKGDYHHAQQLFDELLIYYRGNDTSEKINYYFAYCYYGNGDYLQAGYYFLKYTQTFPTSKLAEECMYMSAYCQYLLTPNASLDQTITLEAMKECQLFIDLYPKSERVAECNKLIDEMREKLEEKAYAIAKLYFKIGSYQASMVAFKNVLRDFPDTKYREEAYYHIFLSNYYYAEKSVEGKKKERYMTAREAYHAYKLIYPDNKYTKEAKNFYTILEKKIN
jgi:outer membrane protein assembly factor BamD